MTIRNNDLNSGATDWSDGNVLYADDLNDTFNEVVTGLMLIDSSTTDTTLYTTDDSSPGSFVTNATITFTPTTSNNILLGVSATFNLWKSDVSGSGGSVSGRVSLLDNGGSQVNGNTKTTSNTTATSFTSYVGNTYYGTFGQSSYTLLTQRQVTDPGGSGTKRVNMQNIVFTAYYYDLQSRTITTSSAKFT